MGPLLESSLPLLRMHWDRELPGGCSAGVLACEFTGRPARCSCWRRDAAATRRRDACATGRFMESQLGRIRKEFSPPWILGLNGLWRASSGRRSRHRLSPYHYEVSYPAPSRTIP